MSDPNDVPQPDDGNVGDPPVIATYMALITIRGEDFDAPSIAQIENGIGGELESYSSGLKVRVRATRTDD